MIHVSKKEITAFQQKILDWFALNKRDLPWRHSRDPYNILVSEVMLQQTQVSRVIPKFLAWMERFPTLEALAESSTRDVLFSWSGLGYNRRALYLKKLAEEVVKNHNGIFSQEEKELRKLPGIGEYTARALLCFAFNKQIAVVDTNIRKVMLVEFAGKIKDDPKEIQSLADALLPLGKAYEWNQALMDFASAHLKKEKIFIPKQSSFKSSKRFYRGQIIRLLLEKDSQTAQSLFARIINNGISQETFLTILEEMEKDGLLMKEKESITLPHG